MTHPTDPADTIRKLDPVDGVRLATEWSNSDAKQALFLEVTAMPIDTLMPAKPAQPAPVERRRFRLATGLAAVAAGLFIAQSVFFSPTAAFAVKPLPNGVIEVTVSSEFRDGSALAAELREFGIDVDVTSLAASPSMVGTASVFGPGGYLPEGLTVDFDGAQGVQNWTIDPTTFSERLTIEMYVAADNEPYAVAAEVFEPGEVLGGLHCALGEPVRADDLLPYLSDLGLGAKWFLVTLVDASDPSISQETEVTQAPAGQVLSGYALDAQTVAFRVQANGVALPSVFYAPRLSDLPCTAEQASAWK